MKKFNHETPGYEHFSAYLAFRRFLDSYLLERNEEKMLSFMEDDICSPKTDEDGVVVGKKEFMELLQVELDVISESIGYKVLSVYGKEIAENIWNIQAEMELSIPNAEEEKTVYITRFTGCFKLSEKGFVVTLAHMSKVGESRDEKDFSVLNDAGSNGSIDKVKAEQMIFDIISKSMPGGIIIGYAQEGYPLYFANDRYLELLGYSSYEEYYKDADGLGTNHIHPDDVDMVNQEIMYSYNTDTQFGIEYRIRNKDGHYIHVYDIGKKMMTPDNKEFIICVLYDMTEDAKLKEILINESSYDALTGIYNRGGGVRTIKHGLKYANAYSFAFFDIDNLKLLNDIYNHVAGDHALKYFADLLLRHFDDRTVLARLGGDEFVAFFKDKLDVKRIQSTFSKLEQDYCSFIEKNYPQSDSSVSIGCVVGTKKCTFDELCRTADELMYEIKKNGKKGFKIVDLDFIRNSTS